MEIAVCSLPPLSLFTLQSSLFYLLNHSGSPRPQGARDDKGGIFTMKGVKRLEFSLCHCEEDSMDDAAIHRVSEDACGVVSSFSGSQWIATGFQPSR